MCPFKLKSIWTNGIQSFYLGLIISYCLLNRCVLNAYIFQSKPIDDSKQTIHGSNLCLIFPVWEIWKTVTWPSSESNSRAGSWWHTWCKDHQHYSLLLEKNTCYCYQQGCWIYVAGNHKAIEEPQNCIYCEIKCKIRTAEMTDEHLLLIWIWSILFFKFVRAGLQLLPRPHCQLEILLFTTYRSQLSIGNHKEQQEWIVHTRNFGVIIHQIKVVGLWSVRGNLYATLQTVLRPHYPKLNLNYLHIS